MKVAVKAVLFCYILDGCNSRESDWQQGNFANTGLNNIRR